MSNLDDLLQQQLEALEKGRSIDEVVEQVPAGAEELAPLIRLVSAVRRLSHPNPQLNGSTARQLAAAARQQEREQRKPEQHPVFSLPVLRPALATLAVLCAVALLLVGGLWMVKPQNARAAVAMDVSGVVEVASSQDASDWVRVKDGNKVRDGQLIRTGEGAGVTLVFFEGSRLTLGANTEIALAKVNGKNDRTLQVVIEQSAGKTTHSVVPLRGKDSLYEVHTPSGSASVHGTIFSVAVNEAGKAHFAVDKGKVLVSSASSELLLDAGQVTDAESEQSVLVVGYQFELKGIVESIVSSDGFEVWIVDGVSFKVPPDIVIDPLIVVGSFVEVEGTITEEGWLADKIELKQPEDTKHEFSGELEDNDGEIWMVSGVSLIVNEDTDVDEELYLPESLGSSVEVTFVIDGEDWIALKIESLEERPTETPVVTETITETETVTPTVTMTVTETVTPTVFIDCTGADPHPTGSKLADRYGVSYEEIMGWKCQKFGFGEIDLAYGLSQQTGVPVEEIFAMKSGGMGWGNIKKAMRQITETPSPSEEPTDEVEPADNNRSGKPKNQPPGQNKPKPPGQNNKPQPPGQSNRPNQSNNANQSCSAAQTNPTALGLANKYGASYEQIMGWYCKGWSWAKIEKQITPKAQKTPKP